MRRPEPSDYYRKGDLVMPDPTEELAALARRWRLRLCAICHWPKLTMLIPVYPAPPPDIAKQMGLRKREEPWCRPCALKVLDRMGEAEYVWRSASEGWPT